MDAKNLVRIGFEMFCYRFSLTTCLCLALTMAANQGCQQSTDQTVAIAKETRPSSDAAIAQFCGGCHVFPPPSSFPRQRWRHEVEQGFRIYRQSGRKDLTPTDVEATVRWFESNSPEEYVFASAQASTNNQTIFERVDVPQESNIKLSKIAHIRPLDSGEILLSELYTGLVCRGTTQRQGARFLPITKVADPVHVEPTDLDGDGQTDFVIADIGSLNPSDQRLGTLWWVHRSGQETLPSVQTPESKIVDWETVPLKTGFSRVCDARPIDYDQDGDQDLVVAEFGFRFEGSIQLLTNRGLDNGVPKFESKTIDQRNGSIHVPVVDLNQDGRPDFMTLVSQEHETIDVYLNQGNGQFQQQRIHAAGDPAYASSGIEVVDLDSDGDLDVIYTNGDTFDDQTPKPFHSVQWLENEGSFPFTHHHLTYMPGVYRAVAGDIDLDGDLDIAAVAVISGMDPISDSAVADEEAHTLTMPGHESFDGVIWLEQTADGDFVRHRILGGQCAWASCELTDLDGDEDLDLLLGRFYKDDDETDSLIYYENHTND